MTIPTPLIDAWRAKMERKLSDFGKKAELAAHLAERYGRTQRSWESHLSSMLHGRRFPNAEVVLAIDLWLSSVNEGKDGRIADADGGTKKASRKPR